VIVESPSLQGKETPGTLVRVADGREVAFPLLTTSEGRQGLPAAGGPPLVLDAALFEDTPHGLVPRIAPDGRQPWNTHRRRAPAARGPRVAIVLVEIGLDEKASASVLATAAPLTLVVSPYANAERGWYRSARWAGHETLLELPVRSLGFPTDDSGPLSFGADTAHDAPLDLVLSRGIGYLGASVAAGQFAARPAAFEPIARALASRGLALVEVGSAVLEPLARHHRLPYLNVAKAVDQEPSPEAIDAALAALEGRAREDGFAAGYARPFAMTIERLAHWAAGLQSRGVALVGVGELLERAVEGEGSKP